MKNAIQKGQHQKHIKYSHCHLPEHWNYPEHCSISMSLTGKYLRFTARCSVCVWEWEEKDGLYNGGSVRSENDRGELLTSRETLVPIPGSCVISAVILGSGCRTRRVLWIEWKVPADIACPHFAFFTEGKSFIQAASGRKKVPPTQLATQPGAQDDALTLFWQSLSSCMRGKIVGVNKSVFTWACSMSSLKLSAE